MLDDIIYTVQEISRLLNRPKKSIYNFVSDLFPEKKGKIRITADELELIKKRAVVDPRNIDITGQKFNFLTAVKFVEIRYTEGGNHANQFWLFRCDCGKEVILRKSSVTKGAVKSCGCKKGELVAKHHTTHGELSNLNDITGNKYNYLTAIKYVKTIKYGKRNSQLWLFKCDCGKEVVIIKNNVILGVTKSCGCQRNRLAGASNITHGDARTRLYNIWGNMLYRCENENCSGFEKYGGRGIKVCEEWHKYLNFKKWALSHGYSENLSIDRIDNDGNYEPSNCRWVTMADQNRNRRDNIIIEYNGERLTASQWAIKLGWNKSVIYQRLKHGWDKIAAITTPPIIH